MLTSRLCTQEQFESKEYAEWCARIRETPLLHRKQWEFVYIAQALFERGMLVPGKRGLGFGVGQEPLAALFASYGCEIVATDQDPTEAKTSGWSDSGQHADNLAGLNNRGICQNESFTRRVSFRVVDMNRIPQDLQGFDFTWSSCAFEHLGSITQGLDFVIRAMECLKPGGIAVHTTEYNVSSDQKTIQSGGTVLFRRRDIESLAKRLRQFGHELELNLDTGNGEMDRHVDVPPYKSAPHLKLAIQQYVSTSIGIIVQRSLSTSSGRPAEPLVGFGRRIRRLVGQLLHS